MFHLKKYITFFLLINSLWIYGNDLITDSITMAQIREGIYSIYNCNFDSAEIILDSLKKKYPDHPVTPFYEGLIYYWKYYPLVEDHAGSNEFKQKMQESWLKADQLKKQGSDIEGVFFELMARSFIVMYYADNGLPAHAISHLGIIYRDILRGFEMQDDFREFLFITGLYNYYREAYPEAYPVYKPAAFFFKRGDREKGLEMLRTAVNESSFVGVEAALFLSLIYINFENKPDSALLLTNRLKEKYPGNSYFLSEHTEMLLANKKYNQARAEIGQLMNMNDYCRMKGNIYMGVYQEKYKKDQESARSYYEAGLQLAEQFGDRVDYTRAYAYIGLSRYYAEKNDTRKAREYKKKAKNASGYAYVLE